MEKLEDKTVKNIKERKEVLTTEQGLLMEEEVTQETLITEDVSADQGTMELLDRENAVPLTSASESTTQTIVTTQQVSSSSPNTTTTIGKN